MQPTYRADLPPTDVDIREEDHPLPPNSYRFILPVLLMQTLRAHPLGRDLFPCAGGFYPDDPRRYECAPLPNNLIYYCVGGMMMLHTAEGVWPVTTGDLVLVPRGLAHVTDSSKSAPWSFYFLAFSGELSGDFVHLLNLPKLVDHLGLDPKMIGMLEDLCSLRNSDFALNTLLDSCSKLRRFFTSLNLAFATRETRSGRARIDLTKIRQFMASHLDGSLTLDDFAHQANLSIYHFARTFKKMTGMSPVAYYNQMRIQQACLLLDREAEPIKAVAAAVGYEDPLYFHRIFRRIVGLTPTAYRKWNTQGADRDKS